MIRRFSVAILGLLALCASGRAAAPDPIADRFHQEIARSFTTADGLPSNDIQLIDLAPDQPPRVFAGGRWAELRGQSWVTLRDWDSPDSEDFVLADHVGKPVVIDVPAKDVAQILRLGEHVVVVTPADLVRVIDGQAHLLRFKIPQIRQATLVGNGSVLIASADGLYHWMANDAVERVPARDKFGRDWAAGEVLGVALATPGEMWIATPAGVGYGAPGPVSDPGPHWRFFEGKDGLPVNEFTGLWAAEGTIWMGTRRGIVRFHQNKGATADKSGDTWHYRQGPRWLPHDRVRQIGIEDTGRVWIATEAGLGCIEFRSMTLAEKAMFYEKEIEQYVKRTPFGYVAEAPLQIPGDKSTANPQDSDNDGLWTAMYGAGQCFAFAATGDPAARTRAEQAFRALRFLQTVTQGGPHSPPEGYVARTIRPVDWPDPNIGRIDSDRAEQQGDRLWKVYEPRWPKSADGQWYWKSDTSSDELDGHFFFYPLYYDFCATTDAEKEEVRDVVRKLIDHLLQHDYVLLDHDGRPTRWAVFGPKRLNHDPDWWAERGLNSLSMLSYLAVAGHVTGDSKYGEASRELIDRHGYAQNAMYPKVQHGPGSGNQSDDEMAFMCYYSLLRCSRDEPLKAQIRFSFFRYWANEASEMNPFFHFAYAAHNLDANMTITWGTFPLSPWPGWLEDSRATLHGFPLDRLNWPHQNSHRLDIVPLQPVQSRDLYEPSERRGYRVNGKVLPVENRHFNHWNTDPWQLDYGGHGNELAAGTVFLLPYYLGMYHGFVEKP